MRNSLLLFLVISCLFSCQQGSVDNANEVKADSTSTKTVAKYPEGENLYFPSGKIKASGKKRNGKREGVWSSWYESGAKNSEAIFVNDQMDGPYQVWYENGQPRITGQYKMETEIGIWYFFTEKGDTLKVVDYDKK